MPEFNIYFTATGSITITATSAYEARKAFEELSNKQRAEDKSLTLIDVDYDDVERA